MALLGIAKRPRGRNRNGGPQGLSKTLDSLIQKTPLRRIASIEEMAAAVVLLASPEASFITGAHLPVDGELAVA
jgi:NAD(P)-dependent dehydrogenase (short-subunit alcohol dehydrogenase family)